MNGNKTDSENTDAFEQFIQKDGADILRFCRIKAGATGDEHYQETTLKFLEKKDKLNYDGNPTSYALSVCIFIWKNMRRKHKNRLRIAPRVSIEDMTQIIAEVDVNKKFISAKDRKSEKVLCFFESLFYLFILCKLR